MKMLTLHQPLASLVAVGAKTIETRTWSASFRGPLAIHAAAKEPERTTIGGWQVGCFTTGHDWRMSHPQAVESGGFDPVRFPLPLGAVVAVCDLVDVVPMVETAREHGERTALRFVGDRLLILRHDSRRWFDADVTDQRPFGDFTPGRYAWILDNVRAVDPIPCKGFQGLRDCPVEIP